MPTPAFLHRPLLTWMALAAVLGLAWSAYLPGLHGGFLFDDFVNLPVLGATGPIDNWPAFWRYITSGTADPTGRPLSLLSFLLDANDWPAAAEPFLRTSLILHLGNGVLLFCLLRALGGRLDSTPVRRDAAALLGTGLWLLHPLFVSTTLYIVQREAILPATFVLLGLLAWIHGRSMLERAPRTGVLWMAGGIGLGTLLAVLCKANGILLPLLAWVLETTVLRTDDRPGPVEERRMRWSRRLLLVLPSLVILAYLFNQLSLLGSELDSRPWTLDQRLLTEPRVLLEYLQLLAMPRVLSTGLYNDGYLASTGFLQPPSTLLALLAILALLALGFALRRRTPAVAAALLFFFAGHLLESTVIPLELYFEHRNYLPAMLLFWPLARAICAWRVSRRLRGAVALSLLALFATITWQRATLWSQPELMAQLWALQNPDSSRAQATAAIYESQSGRPDLAAQRIHLLWLERPHDLQLALNYVNAACAARGLDQGDVERVATALHNATEGDQLLHQWLSRALLVARKGDCPGMDLAAIERWIAAALANRRLADIPGRQQDLHSLSGSLALSREQPERALAEFNRALEAWTTPRAAAMQAAFLATHGHYRQALAHLDHYETLQQQAGVGEGWNMQRLHAWVLDMQDYWPHELAILRGKLQAELASPNAQPSDVHPDSGSVD